MRRRIVQLTMAGLLGGLSAAVLTLTASATTLPMTASFAASDFQWTASTGGNSVDIAPGGTVSFSYPSGTTVHNVDFGSGPQPSSCEVGDTAQAPPVPTVPTAPGWTASCTFNTAGTYTFHCDRHTFMTGTIHVGTQTTTTETTSTGSQSTTTMTMTMPMGMPMPTTTTGTATTPQLSPMAGSARTAIRLSSRGATQIRGTLRISDAGKGGHATQ